jgi:hypothetical protein
MFTGGSFTANGRILSVHLLRYMFFQEMKVKDFSPVVETHSTPLKIRNKYEKVRNISSHNWRKCLVAALESRCFRLRVTRFDEESE